MLTDALEERVAITPPRGGIGRRGGKGPRWQEGFDNRLEKLNCEFIRVTFRVLQKFE